MSTLPSPDVRAVVGRHAADLLRELADAGSAASPVRVADAGGGLMCLIVVWPADARMPTATGERPKPKVDGGRDGCRADVLAVIQAAGQPMTRKDVIRALRVAGRDHGAGTVAKALADLTRSRELVNPKDKRGYRLLAWLRPNPTLFDDA